MSLTDRITSRYLRVSSLDPKVRALLEKVRRKSTGAVDTVAKAKTILDAVGGWSVEPFVGLAMMNAPRQTHYVADFVGDIRSVEEVHKIAKAHEVRSIPTSPKPDTYYTMGVTDIKPEMEGRHMVQFKLWIGAWGFKIVAPDGKTLEVLPDDYKVERALGWRNSSQYDLRKPLKFGKRSGKILSTSSIPGWLFEQTKLIDQVNDLLGGPVETKSTPRTRNNTGSCPCCFRNIKLKDKGSDHPVMVNHGFERPGWGYNVGNCVGVGFPPFELSPEGTKHLLNDVLKPQVKFLQGRIDSAKEGKLTHVTLPGGQMVGPTDPLWGHYLKSEIRMLEMQMSSVTKDINVVSQLLSSWKARPLPEPGDELKIWK